MADRRTRPRRGHELAPRWRDRARRAVRPGWTRSILVRRAIAALLVLAALGAFLADRRAAPGDAVVVATRDLRPGAPLTADDVAVLRVRPEIVPDGALALSADARGRTVTSAVRRGEILTDSRLLGSRLPRRLVGDPRARLVPVHLADTGTADLLEPGDVVDVLTKGGAGDPPVVVAEGAVVALGRGAKPGRRESGSPVLLAMGSTAANRVAAAGLTTALTVVIH
ncbi:MAG: SAF domain-containing protein [Gordonia sp. (in: high G+C Gram-positive bacteria)]|uniref:SAF domain-containing protein n=1 Tax=Gordonia sp. (in: high G+C Gram-positive bacteria) TaxID=84139 RepID=UPI0039E6BA9A